MKEKKERWIKRRLGDSEDMQWMDVVSILAIITLMVFVEVKLWLI